MKLFLTALLLTATAAHAQSPKVVTDIAPVHGLVSSVMMGLATPELIVDPTASPHEYAMRPSQARAVQSADIVFWVGPTLTPWLDQRLETLAPTAQTIELLNTDGLTTLEFRSGTFFEPHDHGDDGHDDHGHEEEHAIDPHAWLDPHNAALWIDQIAATLAAQDPQNAAAYRQNAVTAKTAIDQARDDVAKSLAAIQSNRFIVFHDAYHYFESSFGIEATAAIALGDAAAPGPARIRALRDLVQTQDITCAFSEPQFTTGMIETVLEGTDAKIAVLDPIGRDIAPGPEFYPTLLRELGQSMADCLR